MSEWWYLTY